MAFSDRLTCVDSVPFLKLAIVLKSHAIVVILHAIGLVGKCGMNKASMMSGITNATRICVCVRCLLLLGCIACALCAGLVRMCWSSAKKCLIVALEWISLWSSRFCVVASASMHQSGASGF